jgi:hypothetical protein
MQSEFNLVSWFVSYNIFLVDWNSRAHAACSHLSPPSLRACGWGLCLCGTGCPLNSLWSPIFNGWRGIADTRRGPAAAVLLRYTAMWTGRGFIYPQRCRQSQAVFRTPCRRTNAFLWQKNGATTENTRCGDGQPRTEVCWLETTFDCSVLSLQTWKILFRPPPIRYNSPSCHVSTQGLDCH